MDRRVGANECAPLTFERHGVKRKRISAAVKATFAIVVAESKNYKNTWKYVIFSLENAEDCGLRGQCNVQKPMMKWLFRFALTNVWATTFFVRRVSGKCVHDCDVCVFSRSQASCNLLVGVSKFFSKCSCEERTS